MREADDESLVRGRLLAFGTRKYDMQRCMSAGSLEVATATETGRYSALVCAGGNGSDDDLGGGEGGGESPRWSW